MKKRTTVVNLFAGPGAGKSTFCAGIFASLKWLGVNCEMALEYAKDLVWQNSYDVLGNQLYVFGKQQNRLYRLYQKVDIVVTDSPLLNSIVYDAQKRPRTKAAFIELVLAEHSAYDNLNFFIERRKRYNPVGRTQTEAEASDLDAKIMEVLYTYGIPYTPIVGVPEEIATVIKAIFAYRSDIIIETDKNDILKAPLAAVLGSGFPATR